MGARICWIAGLGLCVCVCVCVSVCMLVRCEFCVSHCVTVSACVLYSLVLLGADHTQLLGSRWPPGLFGSLICIAAGGSHSRHIIFMDGPHIAHNTGGCACNIVCYPAAVATTVPNHGLDDFDL